MEFTISFDGIYNFERATGIRNFQSCGTYTSIFVGDTLFAPGYEYFISRQRRKVQFSIRTDILYTHAGILMLGNKRLVRYLANYGGTMARICSLAIFLTFNTRRADATELYPTPFT